MVLYPGKLFYSASTSADWQHDKNNDGYLTKDEVIQLSESLLVCHKCSTS